MNSNKTAVRQNRESAGFHGLRPSGGGRGEKSFLRELLALVALLAVMTGLMLNFQMPWSRSIRRDPPIKWCYANMRVYLGAIEMYNMDHSAMITSIGSTTMQVLLDGKYLHSPCRCPGDSEPALSQREYYRKLERLADNLHFDGFMPRCTPVPGGTYSLVGWPTDKTEVICSLHGSL